MKSINSALLFHCEQYSAKDQNAIFFVKSLSQNLCQNAANLRKNSVSPLNCVLSEKRLLFSLCTFQNYRNFIQNGIEYKS